MVYLAGWCVNFRDAQSYGRYVYVGICRGHVVIMCVPRDMMGFGMETGLECCSQLV